MTERDEVSRSAEAQPDDVLAKRYMSERFFPDIFLRPRYTCYYVVQQYNALTLRPRHGVY